MLVLRTAGILLSDPRPSASKDKRGFDGEQKNKKNKEDSIGQINLVNIDSVGENNLT